MTAATAFTGKEREAETGQLPLALAGIALAGATVG
jgi:hypothetical protein